MSPPGGDQRGWMDGPRGGVVAGDQRRSILRFTRARGRRALPHASARPKNGRAFANRDCENLDTPVATRDTNERRRTKRRPRDYARLAQSRRLKKGKRRGRGRGRGREKKEYEIYRERRRIGAEPRFVSSERARVARCGNGVPNGAPLPS